MSDNNSPFNDWLAKDRELQDALAKVPKHVVDLVKHQDRILSATSLVDAIVIAKEGDLLTAQIPEATLLALDEHSRKRKKLLIDQKIAQMKVEHDSWQEPKIPFNQIVKAFLERMGDEGEVDYLALKQVEEIACLDTSNNWREAIIKRRSSKGVMKKKQSVSKRPSTLDKTQERLEIYNQVVKEKGARTQKSLLLSEAAKRAVCSIDSIKRALREKK